MTRTVKQQILQVRDDGRSNMLDVNGVMYVANDLQLYDLVVYLDDQDNRKEYWHFIMTGEASVEEKDHDAEHYVNHQIELLRTMTIKRVGNWFLGVISGCNFQAKVTEEDSEWGISGGRIVKLFVTTLTDGKDRGCGEILSYERGWNKYPETELGKIIADALYEYFEQHMDEEVP